MKWMQERDALIAQTRTFVQSVAERQDDAGLALRRLAPEPPRPEPAALDLPEHREPAKPAKMAEPTKAAAPTRTAPPSETMPPQKGAPESPPLARPIVRSELHNELKMRIASFRAHQERFNREREEYFSATLAKLRAAVKDVPPRRHDN